MQLLSRALSVLLALSFLAVVPAPAFAQQQDDEGWDVTIYPLLGWLPIYGADFDIPDIDLPDPPDGGDGGTGGGTGGRVKTDTSINGALFFGFGVEKGRFRVDGYGLWAAIGVDRPERPILNVDLDLIYGTLTGGFEVFDDIFVTGGVRRVALDISVDVDDFPTLQRKPGIWNPTVGVAWHPEMGKWALHALAEYGGFGVGAENEFFAAFSADWKITRHVGLNLGYTFWAWEIEFEIDRAVLQKKFIADQTLHGPIAGIGLFF